MTDPKTAEVKVVPVEPTEAMIEAGYLPWINEAARTGRIAVRDIYLAMLAASPPAETGEGSVWRPGPMEDLGDGHWVDVEPQPVSPSEGEAVAFCCPEHLTRIRRQADERREASSTIYGYPTGTYRTPLYTHPASDQSDTERMRKALECVDVVGDRTLRIILPGAGGSYGFTAPESSEIGPIVLALFAEIRRAALAEKAADK